MTTPNSHLDYDLLSAYLDDEVTAAERARVEAHLPGCQRCRTELESLRWTVNLLQRLPTVPAPRTFYVTEAMVEPKPRRVRGWSSLARWQQALAPLAAVAALLLCLVLVQTQGRSPTALPTAADTTTEETFSIAQAPESVEEEALPESESQLGEVEDEALRQALPTDDTLALQSQPKIEESIVQEESAEADIITEEQIAEADIATEEQIDESAAALSVEEAAPVEEAPVPELQADEPLVETADEAVPETTTVVSTPLQRALPFLVPALLLLVVALIIQWHRQRE